MFFRPGFCIVRIQDSLAFHPYQLGYQATCISYFFSLPKFAQKISHFRTFSLGPPFAFCQKPRFSMPWEKIAKNRGFRYLGKNCHFSSNRCFSARFFCMVKIQDSLAFHPYQLGYQATCISYFFSLPKFAQKISNFRTFCLSPPFAFWPKTAVFEGTLGKIAISRLIDVFPPGFLHSQNLGQFSFPSIPIRLLGDLYFLFFQPSEVCPKNQPFSNIFPWSPLCILAKNGGFRYLGKICHFSSNRCFSARFFAQSESRIVQLSIHTNQAIRGLVFPIFLASQVCPKNQPFSNILPWSPLCILAKNRGFRTLRKNCHFSSNRCFSAQVFAQSESRIVQLSIHTNQAIRRLVFLIFLAFRSLPKKSAIFEHFALVPPLHFGQKPRFSIPWEKLPFLV